MGLSVTTTIFLFVVCLCGGIAIGAMFGRAKKLQPESPPEQEGEKAQEKELPAPVAPGLAVAGDTEILRAWQDRSGKPWLEMDGQRLERKEDMQPGQKKKLLKLVLDLRPWLDVPPAAPLPAPAPKVQEPKRFGIGTKPKASVPAVEPSKPPVVLKSIVEQIDEVLQNNLSGTLFDNQDIHLLEGPGGAVIVQIVNEKYEGIDAVPQAEIKALIRQAVTDWEKGAK